MLGAARASAIGRSLRVPEFVALTHQAASTNDTTLAVPAGIAVGDLLVAILVRSGTRNWNALAGWTLAHHNNDSWGSTDGTTGTIGIQGVYWRIATGGEAASYTFPSSNADVATLGVMLAYRGPDAASPIEHITPYRSWNNDGNVPAPSITPDRVGRLITTHARWSQLQGTRVAPAGMTQRVSSWATQFNGEWLVCDQAVSAGATGIKTATGFHATEGRAEMALSLFLPGS